MHFELMINIITLRRGLPRAAKDDLEMAKYAGFQDRLESAMEMISALG